MQNEKYIKYGEAIYISLKRNAVVEKSTVHVKDIGEVYCLRKDIQHQVQDIVVERLHPQQTIVVSGIYVIEQIQENFPDKLIQSLGENDVIVSQKVQRSSKWKEAGKVLFVALVLFFGSAFTIMSFHGDVGIQEMFARFYQQMTGQTSDGVTILEISYTVGIFVGILVFFNHLSGKKVTPEPTPVQVQMRDYEKKVDEAFIENVNRKGSEESVK